MLSGIRVLRNTLYKRMSRRMSDGFASINCNLNLSYQLKVKICLSKY